jgi:hypothetical protein
MGKIQPFALLLAAGLAACADDKAFNEFGDGFEETEAVFDEFDEDPACVDGCGAVVNCVGNRFPVSACINGCDDSVAAGDFASSGPAACADCVARAGTSRCVADCNLACADLVDFKIFLVTREEDDDVAPLPPP